MPPYPVPHSRDGNVGHQDGRLSSRGPETLPGFRSPLKYSGPGKPGPSQVLGIPLKRDSSQVHGFPASWESFKYSQVVRLSQEETLPGFLLPLTFRLLSAEGLGFRRRNPKPSAVGGPASGPTGAAAPDPASTSPAGLKAGWVRDRPPRRRPALCRY